MGNLCWMHAQRNLGLRVKESSRPNLGKGLFAVKPFVKNETIAMYTGECPLTKQQIDLRYPGVNADYVMCVNSKNCVDGRKTSSSYARYANHSRNPVVRNAHLGGNSCDSFKVYSTRNIKASKDSPQEIFVDYGKGYKFK